MSMMCETLEKQGQWFFRWRSYVLLGFIPLGVYAISQPGAIDVHFGELAASLFKLACIALAILGLAIRIITVGCVPRNTSGRNTREQIADNLNVTGIYSITRNPLYLGNSIIYASVAAYTQSIMFFLIMTLFVILYLERIIATEEDFLTARFSSQFRDWVERVPIFFPRFSLWVPPALPFSIRNALRREYSGFFAIVVSFVVVDLVHQILAYENKLVGFWHMILFLGGATIYVGLRSLKKYSSILDVEGR